MILDEIFARSKEELGIKKKRVSQNALEKKAERILASKNPPQPEKVLQALRKNADKFNIIAEVKKASPSKGIIRSKFFPTRQIRAGFLVSRVTQDTAMMHFASHTGLSDS